MQSKIFWASEKHIERAGAKIINWDCKLYISDTRHQLFAVLADADLELWKHLMFKPVFRVKCESRITP